MEEAKGLIERHTFVNAEGKSVFNGITAMQELEVRIKAQYQTFSEAIGSAAKLIEDLEARVKKLEPTIEIFKSIK